MWIFGGGCNLAFMCRDHGLCYGKSYAVPAFFIICAVRGIGAVEALEHIVYGFFCDFIRSCVFFDEL